MLPTGQPSLPRGQRSSGWGSTTSTALPGPSPHPSSLSLAAVPFQLDPLPFFCVWPVCHRAAMFLPALVECDTQRGRAKRRTSKGRPCCLCPLPAPDRLGASFFHSLAKRLLPGVSAVPEDEPLWSWLGLSSLCALSSFEAGRGSATQHESWGRPTAWGGQESMIVQNVPPKGKSECSDQRKWGEANHGPHLQATQPVHALVRVSVQRPFAEYPCAGLTRLPLHNVSVLLRVWVLEGCRTPGATGHPH